MTTLLWTAPIGWMLVSISGTSGPAAWRADIDRISSEASALGTKVDGLEPTYLKPEAISGAASYAARLADAEILFLLGDYQRACWILYDLADGRAHEHEQLYGKALHYLGEALFQLGHDQDARDHFRELLRVGANDYLADSVRRLIQIADRTGRWEGIKDAVAVLAKQGPLPADVAYIYAKSQLRQGQFADVAPTVASIGADHGLSPKAQYVVGVAQLQSGDLDAARQTFAALKQTNDTYPNAAEIRDLAALNQARIFLEQGRFGEAVDAFQFIGRSSPRFEQALYEISWTYVRAALAATEPIVREGDYQKAVKTLEILLLAEEQTPVMSEARLLLGNIYLRLGQFEQAEMTFRDVVRAFGPWRDQMSQYMAPSPDLGMTLYARAAAGHGYDLVSGLPAAWTDDQPALQRAVRVANGVETGGTWVKDATVLAGNLHNLLGANQQHVFSPVVHEAGTKVIEYHRDLFLLTERLLDLQRDLVAPVLDAKAFSELADLVKKRRDFAPAYQATLAAGENGGVRAAERQERVREVEQRGLRLRYELDSMRAQMSAITLWLHSHPSEIAANDEADFRERLQHQNAVIDELDKEQQALADDLANERGVVAHADRGPTAASDGRTAYQLTLERERVILEEATEHLSATNADGVELVHHLWTILAGAFAGLEGFAAKLDHMVVDQTATVQAEVVRQQGLIDGYQSELAAVRAEAQQTVGEVATSALTEVRNRFRDVVLRADVGVIDVAWALKEVQTREISRRVSEQKEELQVLDNEYGEVVAGP